MNPDTTPVLEFSDKDMSKMLSRERHSRYKKDPKTTSRHETHNVEMKTRLEENNYRLNIAGYTISSLKNIAIEITQMKLKDEGEVFTR